MLKRKYMIIVASAIVSVLVGSLFYSNLAFGASGSSGSWGAIRFVEPNESMENQSIWKDAATFNWTPQNGTNNAILFVMYYVEYKATQEGTTEIDFRIKINDWMPYGDISLMCNTTYTLTPSYQFCHFEWVIDQASPQPNQESYEIKLQFRRGAGDIPVYVRNINIIITVADGMVPNEYYKVELPSEGVGGLYIPVDKFSLLAPYIALVSTMILVASMSVAYIKYRKKR